MVEFGYSMLCPGAGSQLVGVHFKRKKKIVIKVQVR